MGWYGPMTHRQGRIWDQWLEDEWNNPNRSDHYAKATTSAVLLIAKGLGIYSGNINDTSIKFTRKKQLTDAELEKQAYDHGMMQKLIWQGMCPSEGFQVLRPDGTISQSKPQQPPKIPIAPRRRR